jgi:hypothetical protein
MPVERGMKPLRQKRMSSQLPKERRVDPTLNRHLELFEWNV